MAATRLRIDKQNVKSTTPRSLVYTDLTNEQVYFAPPTGADYVLKWDDTAGDLDWLATTSLINIYNNDGTISGTRLVEFSNPLTFQYDDTVTQASLILQDSITLNTSESGVGTSVITLTPSLASFVINDVTTDVGNGVNIAPNSSKIFAQHNTTGDNVSLELSDRNGVVSSTYSLFQGLRYFADYSANFTALSLVTKDYVDTAVSGVTIALPTNEIAYGTGTSITSNDGFITNGASVAIANDGAGLAGMLRISSPSQGGDFVFDVASTSGYRNAITLADAGLINNVNSSSRPHLFTGESGKYRLRLANNGTAIFGDDNTNSSIILNAGTLAKRWGILTGSTPNPIGGGFDESIQMGMNLPGMLGYNSSYNSLRWEMETNYVSVGNNYDEFYFTWERAADGLPYRNIIIAFQEYGGTPLISTSYVGSFDVRPTTPLGTFSSTPITAVFQENRNILFGGNPLYNFRKFEVHSDAAGESTMFIGSNNQHPSLGFGNLVGVNEPDYAVIEMQNIAAGAGVESGRFNFKTRNAGTLATRFTMLESGGFQVVNQAGTGNALVGTDASGIQYRTALDPATVTAGLLPSGTTGQLLSHNGTTWVGASPISGTVNYVPKFGTTTSITNSQIFDNGTSVGVGTVSPSSKMHLYTSASGAGSNGLFVQQNDATAGISHTSRFTTEQQGGGSGRTLFYAASPNTGTSNGQFDIITENGGAYMMALGPQITGGTNALSLYNNAGTVEANRLSSSGTSWLNGGNVGIGTTSASQTLDVNGNVRLRSGLYDSLNSAGTAGYILSSTGTATEWIPAPTGANIYNSDGTLTGNRTLTAGTSVLSFLFNNGAGLTSSYSADFGGQYLTAADTVADTETTLSISPSSTFFVYNDYTAGTNSTLTLDADIYLKRLGIIGNQGFTFNGSGMIVDDSELEQGMEYIANYASYFATNPRSIPDVGYVASLIAATTPTGVVGQIPFYGTTTTLTSEAASGTNSLFWNATDNRLAIARTTADYTLDVGGTGLFRGPANTTANNFGFISSVTTTNSGVNVAFWTNSLNATGNNVVQILTGNGTPPTGGYGIYQADGNRNYFAGNVGIGTTNPGFPLDVVGIARFQGRIYDVVNSAGSSGNVMTSTGSAIQWATAASVVAAGGGVTGTGTSTRVAFWSGSSTLSSSNNLYWDNTNGRLGIGISTVTHLLQLTSSDSRIHVNTDGGVNSAMVSFSLANSEKAFFGAAGSTNAIVSGANAGDFVIRSSNLRTLFTQDNGSTIHMAISAAGLVGIRKAVPTAMLDVYSPGSTTAVQIQGTASYPRLLQYFKPDGSTLWYNQWDGGNFHHYFNSAVYYNVSSGQSITYNGPTNTGIRISGGMRLFIDPPINGSQVGIAFGANGYATAGTPSTRNRAMSFITWAWNGVDGSTISSSSEWEQTQQSATNGDARLTLINSTSQQILNIQLLTRRMGVNQSSPTGQLHIGSGSATAGTAPLKFTSGVNLTSPESGAMEWDGSRLYITQASGPTRQTLAYLTDVSGAVATGVVGQIPFYTSTTAIGSETGSGENSFTWDATNNRLGVGTTSPAAKINVLSPIGVHTLQLDYTYEAGASVSAIRATNQDGFATFYLGTNRTQNEGILTLSAPSGQGSGSGLNFFSASGTKSGIFQLDQDGNYVFRTNQFSMYFDFYNSAWFRDSSLTTSVVFSSIGLSSKTGSTPTAKVHIGAGTTSASSAPIKFTSGTNMTTPESGAMEWDGSRLYMTQASGPTRQTVAYLTDVTGGTSITDEVYPIGTGTGIEASGLVRTSTNLIESTDATRTTGMLLNMAAVETGINIITGITSSTTFNPISASRAGSGSMTMRLNQSGTGDCLLYLQGNSTGDSYTLYNTGAANFWTSGVDTSDSRIFKITTGASPSLGTTVFAASTAGNVGIRTNPHATVDIHMVGELMLDLGSDATGDVYYRAASGQFTRLPAGTNGHVLTLASGIPSWAAAGGADGNGIYDGGGSLSGTTTVTQGANALTFYGVGATDHLTYLEIDPLSDTIIIYSQDTSGATPIKGQVYISPTFVSIGIEDDAIPGIDAGYINFQPTSSTWLWGSHNITFSGGGITITDGVGSGMVYAADYSNSILANNRSIPDIFTVRQNAIENYSVISSTTSPVNLNGTAPDYLISQGATQATFTFSLPATPDDGEVCKLTFHNIVTTLTITAQGGISILGTAATTAAVGTQLEYKYYTSVSAWIRVK